MMVPIGKSSPAIYRNPDFAVLNSVMVDIFVFWMSIQKQAFWKWH